MTSEPTEDLVSTTVNLMDNSLFSLGLCSMLGLLIGGLLGRLIGAGRELTGVMALLGLVVGIGLFFFSQTLEA